MGVQVQLGDSVCSIVGAERLVVACLDAAARVGAIKINGAWPAADAVAGRARRPKRFRHERV